MKRTPEKWSQQIKRHKFTIQSIGLVILLLFPLFTFYAVSGGYELLSKLLLSIITGTMIVLMLVG
jgi:hypothetical protein